MYSYEQVFSATLEYFCGDELATNVFCNKYVLKDKEGNFHELTPADMHRRLAKEFARIEAQFGGGRALSEETIYSYLDHFKYIVPQGSPMMGIGNNFVNLSLSNCFVIASPEDTMSSIIDTGRDLANISKRRGGVGLDLSSLRPDGSAVSNAAGTSSGAWSFAEFYSNVGRMVGQNGRRAAIMLTMDVRHPDIEKFAEMKIDRSKVTGANISVKVNDEFMYAVKNDEDFTLQFPIDSDDPIIRRVVKARDLWDTIVGAATNCAEPGIIMWDNMLMYLPAQCYKDYGFDHITTNPCSELILSAYDSCRLISLNLKSFVKNAFSDDAIFDFDGFAETVSVAQRLSDDLVELELEKLKNLIEKSDTDDERVLFEKLYSACEKGRRTGLGTHGLADAIACLNLAYDSDAAIEIIDGIYGTLKVGSYRESVELSKERGAFSCWNWDLEKDNKFIQSLPEDLKEEICAHGRRNISNLTNAPTGSVSLVSQTSSGIEPVFKNSHIRRKKRNHNEEVADTDFVDDMGDHWLEFEVFHHNAKEWLNANPGEKLADFFVEAGNIDWDQRIKVQATAQRHIDHSISSTINLPKGTSPEVVGSLYMKAWEAGLKGITIYVDGSRSGVLVEKETFNYREAPDRSEELECDIHTVSIKGEKWVILVGLMDGRPYEVFGGLSENIEIPAKYKKGTIIKVTHNKSRANRYDLRLNGLKIKNIIKMFDNTTYQVHTRMVSLGLRHGARPSFLVEQLQKDPDNDLTSFSKVLARVLKKYIEDGTKVTGGGDKVCPDCETDNLTYQEGCVTCANCGWSKCM